MCRRFFCLVLCISFAALHSYADGSSNAVRRITVDAARSYTGEAFEYTRVLKEKVCHHQVYTVTYPSPVVSDFPENNTVPAELYLPDGLDENVKVPAVVCMHILNGDFALCRMMCSRLSEAGLVAMFFKQPYYGSRGGSEGRRRLLKSVDVLINGFDQSTADAQRAFDIVQSLPGVDAHRLGVSGISLGAIRAGALCAYEPRIQRAYLSLVAGDLKRVILSARETRDLRAFIEKLSDEEQEKIWACTWRQDPLNAVPQLKKLAAAGHLRMVRAENDQIMPPECSLKLFEAVGSPQSEMCLAGMGHYSAMAGLAGIMDDLTAFFAEDMPAGWKPPERGNELTAEILLGNFLKDLSALIAAAPQDGCAHMAGLRARIEQKGKTDEFRFDLCLGTEGRFRLSGDFPEVGHAGLGRGAYPWINGGTNLFCGTEGVTGALKLADLIGQDALLKYRMAVGLAAGASLSPDLIRNYADLRFERGPGSKTTLVLTSRKKDLPGSVHLVCDGSGRTPLKALWTIGESVGTVTFTHWQINAAFHESMFDPSGNLSRRSVPERDVLQMFASVFRFLADKAE